MARPKTQNSGNYYFTSVEEQAVIDYNNTTDTTEREKIFNEVIYPALYKITECVYNKTQSFTYITEYMGPEHGIKTALAHLATIIPQYNKERGKAYSFFTFCCKNFLIQLNDECYKRHLRDWSINEHSDDSAEESRIYTVETMRYEDDIHARIDMKEFLLMSIAYWESKRHVYCLKPFHHKLMDEMIELMRHPDRVEFVGYGFGKKEILKYLRDRTGYSTQKIMTFMKRLKTLQSRLLKEYIATANVTGDGLQGYWDWRNKEFVITD